jgi:hypothetical protein
VLVNVQDVDVVAGFVPSGQCQDLVDGEIDVVEQVAAALNADGRHETPGGVMRPIDPRRVAPARNERPNVSGLAQLDGQHAASAPEHFRIGRERRCNPLLRIVEEVQVIAEPA